MDDFHKFGKLILINVGAITIIIIGITLQRENTKDFIDYYITFISTEVAYLIGKNSKPHKPKKKKGGNNG